MSSKWNGPKASRNGCRVAQVEVVISAQRGRRQLLHLRGGGAAEAMTSAPVTSWLP